MNPKLAKYLEGRRKTRAYLGKLDFDPESAIACLGYEGAKKMGILEIYKDALGMNFNRKINFYQKYPELLALKRV